MALIVLTKTKIKILHYNLMHEIFHLENLDKKIQSLIEDAEDKKVFVYSAQGKEDTGINKAQNELVEKIRENGYNCMQIVGYYDKYGEKYRSAESSPESHLVVYINKNNEIIVSKYNPA